MAIFALVILGFFFLQFGLAQPQNREVVPKPDFCYSTSSLEKLKELFTDLYHSTSVAVGDILLNETCPCDNVKKAYNLNCNKYYECENGELYLKDCGTGKAFDQNALTCMSTSKAMCTPDPSFKADGWIGSKCISVDDKLKQNEWNCHKYFQCAPQGLILKACAGNLYFDETNQICGDWPSDTSSCDPCIGSVSYLYGVGSNLHVYRTVPNGSWSKFSDGYVSVTKIIIHGDTIYGIGTDNAVYQTSATSGGSWAQVAPPHVTDLAYSNGYLYGVGPIISSMPSSGNQIWRTVPNNGSWSKFTDGDVSNIIIHEDIIYGIGTDNAVYQNSATHEFWGWAKVASPSVSDLAYSNGYLYGVGENMDIWRTIPNGSWSLFANEVDVAKIIIHGDIMYGIGTDNAVYQTSATSGGPWTKITAPYVTDLAYYSNGLI